MTVRKIILHIGMNIGSPWCNAYAMHCACWCSRKKVKNLGWRIEERVVLACALECVSVYCLMIIWPMIIIYVYTYKIFRDLGGRIARMCFEITYSLIYCTSRIFLCSTCGGTYHSLAVFLESLTFILGTHFSPYLFDLRLWKLLLRYIACLPSDLLADFGKLVILIYLVERRCTSIYNNHV